MDMDPQLVEKIVHEVKSQGVFDEFRRDVMADCDTKPAYQNLRQRVEVSVKKFLSEQRWTPEMNKNQLRERLRRHITETRANFLDVGVERIVDQVVNPKIDSVFRPRIEEITYKYLGLSPPPPLPQNPYESSALMHSVFPPLPMNGGGAAGSSIALKVETMPVASLLPTDLEQVSPDSDKATVKSECKEEQMAEDNDMDLETEEKPDDDDESPPFEPLKHEVELRDSDMDTSDSPEPPTQNEDTYTSSQQQQQDQQPQQDTQTQGKSVSLNPNAELYPHKKDVVSRTHFLDVAETAVASVVIVADAVPEESQLSQVSSDSRISVTSQDLNEDNNTEQTQKSQSSGGGGGAPEDAAVNISEEAQMPKFNENSSNETAGGVNGHDQSGPQLHFDIKKDEIKFEGTERKTNLPPDVSNDGDAAFYDGDDDGEDQTAKPKHVISSGDQKKSENTQPNATFHFSATTENKSVSEVFPKATEAQHNQPITSTPTTIDSSFGSSLEDTNSLQLSASNCGATEKFKSGGDVDSNGVTAEKNETISAKDVKESATKHISASCSSSSRHKKHSKEKRRSHDKDRHHRSSKSGAGESEKEKEKSRRGSEKDKDKERHQCSGHSRSKHSSSSSSAVIVKNASLSHSNSKTPEASSSFSTKSEKSGQHETKRERRREGGNSEKHRKSSSSSSALATSSKEHTKQQRKTTTSSTSAVVPTDDHNESKEKLYWRKSTDSNDEDKSPPGNSSGAKGVAGYSTSKNNKSCSSTSNSKSKSKNATSEVNLKSTQNDALAKESIKESISMSCTLQPPRSKVIILNDILENPSTDFIALETTLTITHANHMQIVSSKIAPSLLLATASIENKTAASPPPLDLHFFEENKNQFDARLRLLDNAMDRCRKVINTLRFDTIPSSQEGEEEEKDDFGSQLTTKIYGSSGTQATLLVDCIQYSTGCSSGSCSEQNDSETSALLPKRYKHSDGASKPSPTPSDISINSKENEQFEKNNVDSTSTKKGTAAACVRSINTVNKLNQQQRYTSEDLYKPRPILSQRSRRRGVDSVI